MKWWDDEHRIHHGWPWYFGQGPRDDMKGTLNTHISWDHRNGGMNVHLPYFLLMWKPSYQNEVIQCHLQYVCRGMPACEIEGTCFDLLRQLTYCTCLILFPLWELTFFHVPRPTNVDWRSSLWPMPGAFKIGCLKIGARLTEDGHWRSMGMMMMNQWRLGVSRCFPRFSDNPRDQAWDDLNHWTGWRGPFTGIWQWVKTFCIYKII